MKKRGNRVGYRVNCFSMIVFSIVATLTRIGKIVKAICSSFGDRNNMFNRKGVWREISLRKTVFTTKSGALADFFFLGFANPFRHSNQL